MAEYPQEFAPGARATVERAIVDVERDRCGARAGVLRVFEAFVRELDVTVRRQPLRWTETRVGATTWAFLDDLFEHARVRGWHLHGPQLRHRRQETTLLAGAITYMEPWADDESLSAVKAAVYQELPTFAFWRDLQDAIALLATVSETSMIPQLQQRAAWLQRQIADKGLSLRRLQTLNGPDSKTTKKILAGQPVTENVLRRLAMALAIDRREIP